MSCFGTGADYFAVSERLRAKAHEIKEHTFSRLADYLGYFEQRVLARGGVVGLCWTGLVLVVSLWASRIGIVPSVP